MRSAIYLLLFLIMTAAALACNSNETLISQNPQPPGKTSTPAPPPADNARRITAEELYKLWERNEVTLIDTRAEPAFKQQHIRGAILVPPGTLTAKYGELPLGKMIVSYCT